MAFELDSWWEREIFNPNSTHYQPGTALSNPMAAASAGYPVNPSKMPGAVAVAVLPSASDNIMTDLAKGEAFGQKYFSEGSLGRLGTSPEMQSILAQRKANLSGLTGQEMQGARDIALQGIRSGTQSNIRALKAMQGGAGLRGGTAAAQLAKAQQAGLQQQKNFERDLMLKQRDVQGEALNQYEQTVGGVQQFDLAQAAKEKMGVLGAGLGIAQLGVSERSGAKAAEAAAQAGQAAPSGLLGSLLGGLF